MYVQCRLERDNSHQVVWIPKKFAQLKRVLKLKGDNDKWINGWVVTFIGSEKEDPPDWRKSIRGHRKKTGDSLPKE